MCENDAYNLKLTVGVSATISRRRQMEFSRKELLASALGALDEHKRFGESIRKARQNHSAQTSQLRGLYEEVDKLTKGKSVVPPSDLLVEVVNTQIADAKALIFRDAYLDRLKSFVPAGDNPAYPDLLLSLRILQQTSERFASMLELERQKHLATGNDLQTIIAALRVAEQDESNFYSEDNEESDFPEGEEEEEDTESDEDDDLSSDDIENEGEDSDLAEEDGEEDGDQTEEYQEYVRKSEVKAKVDGSVSDAWFRKYGDEVLFDFKKLDRVGIPTYEPPRDGITYEPIAK
jgi:hypothetical protein